MQSKKIYITTIVLVLIFIAISAFFVIQNYNGPATDMIDNNTTDSSNLTPASSLVWEKDEIKYDGKTILSINDFPDEIDVAKDISFGSSVVFTGAKLSPDRSHIAISISGGVHEFGWLYEFESKKITPVAFSFDGGVDVKNWKNNSEVIFDITSPKPATSELVIDIDNLPSYPRLKSNTGAEIRGEMGEIGCPEMMIINKMPGPGAPKEPYYIANGERVEVSDYDPIWLKANCDVPVQEVY